MNKKDFYINSNVRNKTVEISAKRPLNEVQIFQEDGVLVDTPRIDQTENSWILNAGNLQCWSPENPRLYRLKLNGKETGVFGYSSLETEGNHQVLLNGAPIFLRGYIRGIVAHDHPDLLGLGARKFYEKNILQAKKYGFNLVRFHSTIPDEEFVAAADRLGMLIHMEIGFAYEYDSEGNKKSLSMDQSNWRETILKYRNHPSVAIFCIGNEMHHAGRQVEVHKLYQTGRELAPGKWIMDNAGWGEFDRETADIFAQHIAYYFPYKHHREMFKEDFCWHLNGSIHDLPMKEKWQNVLADVEIRRTAVPRKPVLAHEALHYIDIPDYEALSRKFDELVKPGTVEKPRYLTQLPQLIARKEIGDRMADYRAASQEFRAASIKIALERLRLSPLCGFEMLQFSDCFKYENKNGIVDFFDDDKNIDSRWMRRFNADSVLLADIPEESTFAGSPLEVTLWLSHFGQVAESTGKLTVFLQKDGKQETIYQIEKHAVHTGLQELAKLTVTLKNAGSYQIGARFECEAFTLENDWKLWAYEEQNLDYLPKLRITSPSFDALVHDLCARGGHTKTDSGVIVTDQLDDALFKALADGKNVFLYYRPATGSRRRMKYYFPGANDRFKPCIWDRGSNLGGVIKQPELAAILRQGRYFDLAMQPLVEEAYKINLDHFPVPVDEWVSGVDKPVRDRMRGLLQGIKHFIDDDTLRNFCYAFTIQVGPGKLMVSTFSLKQRKHPVVKSYFAALLRMLPDLNPKASIAPELLIDYLVNAPEQQEDVMNHFWELDDKPVEDTLFWEESGVDLSKLK